MNSYSESGQQQKMSTFQLFFFLGISLHKLKTEIIEGGFLLCIFSMTIVENGELVVNMFFCSKFHILLTEVSTYVSVTEIKVMDPGFAIYFTFL